MRVELVDISTFRIYFVMFIAVFSLFLFEVIFLRKILFDRFKPIIICTCIATLFLSCYCCYTMKKVEDINVEYIEAATNSEIIDSDNLSNLFMFDFFNNKSCKFYIKLNNSERIVEIFAMNKGDYIELYYYKSDGNYILYNDFTERN